MTIQELMDDIAAKGSNKEAIANRLMAKKADVSVLIDGMKAKPGDVKFGCEKVLQIVSEKCPEVVYPEADTASG